MQLEPLVRDDDLVGIMQVPNSALDRPNPLGVPESLELALGREIIIAAERRRRGMPPLAPLMYSQGDNSGTIEIGESAIAEVLNRLTALTGS